MSEETKPGLIYQLIPKIMHEVGAIGKGRRNAQQGYQFRGIDDMYNAMQEPLSSNGVFVVPTVLEERREQRETKSGGNLTYTILKVKHTFYASDGSHIESVTMGEAMDSADKSCNKAMSAAMKYALIEVFSIPTEGDNDADAQTPDVKAPAKTQAAATSPFSEPEYAKAVEELEVAFSARGFEKPAAAALIKALLKQVKQTSLHTAGRPFVDKLITNINAGKYDDRKTVKTSKAA